MNRNWYECPDCHVRVHKEMRGIHLQNCQGVQRNKISSLSKNKQSSLKKKENDMHNVCRELSFSSEESLSDNNDDISEEVDEDFNSDSFIESEELSDVLSSESYTEVFDRRGDFIGFFDLSSSFIHFFELYSNPYIETINIELMGSDPQERLGFTAFVMDFIRNFEIRKSLSEELFNKLSVKKLNELDSLPFDLKKCMICIELFKKNEELISLPCKHLYHKDCIKKWLDMNVKCPICKVVINEHNVRKN